MQDYPGHIIQANHVEPVPRRIRAVAAGVTVLDTTAARYVWEASNYPQYYVPLADVRADLLVPEGRLQDSARGQVEVHELKIGDSHRPGAAKVLRDSTVAGLSDTVRFDWSALDAWYEEDERVFVHPRNPYVRVDTLRSTRRIRLELEGVVLAESSSPVMLFETGLPTRYYLDRTDIDFTQLETSDTVTSCPYKGTTTGYWSADLGDRVHRDIAWCYDFPAREVLAIAGLVAFYNEKVDIVLDGRRLERPSTQFARSGG